MLAYAGSCCREEGFGLPGQGCGVEDGWQEDQEVEQVQELSAAQGWFLVQHGRIGADLHAPNVCKDSADAGDEESHAKTKGCESRTSSSTSLGKRARDDETDEYKERMQEYKYLKHLILTSKNEAGVRSTLLFLVATLTHI